MISLNNSIMSEDDSSSLITKAMIRETIALGKALLELEAFCALNILVVRQALIRYDAFARSFEGTPLMEFYLKTVLRSTVPHDETQSSSPNFFRHELRQILLHTESKALCENFARLLDLLGRERTQLLGQESQSEQVESSKRTAWTGMGNLLQTVVDRFRKDREDLHCLVLSSYVDSTTTISTKNPAATNKSQHSTTKRKSIAKRLVDFLSKNVLLGMFIEDQFGWYLHGTLTRGRSLTDEMKSLTRWKRQSQRRWSMSRRGILKGAGNLIDISTDVSACGVAEAFLENFECDALPQCGNTEANKKWDDKSRIEDVSTSESKFGNRTVVTTQQKFNLFMALAGGFLYCMNYYIVEPSSTMYVNALGAHDAAGAALIGMMPIASFLAAIVYSVWTNTVFRQPFLLSCTLMVTGNIIYSSAFNYKSLLMALVGRFLTGLGGPKMIVRRYMADTTSVSIRTSVNAGFGMVVAAGSALGPGCAILLSNFEFILPLPGGSELWFNSMTGPGWFMATLWGFFSVALFFGFREQERIGLAEKLEQDQMEQWNEKIRQEQDTEASCNRIEEGSAENILFSSSQGGVDIVEEIPAPKDEQHATNAHAGKTKSAMAKTNNRNGHFVTYVATTKPSSPSCNHLNQTISFGDESTRTSMTGKSSASVMSECYHEESTTGTKKAGSVDGAQKSLWIELQSVYRHFLFPVRICMGLLFAKVFVIETLVSCTSVLSKNRYGWNIQQVGMLGCANGFSVIPVSIMVGKLSLQYQDRWLMIWLLSVGMAGMCLLVDGSDFIDTSDALQMYNNYTDDFTDNSDAPQTYNESVARSVGPMRYVMGYFVTYLSIQSFEGIIGSALSKLIPTALAQGTFNSGLLATLVDTFGRSCGDLFISLMGFWNIRQLMNLLFVPGVLILATCLVIVRKYYDLLAV
jgi:hypothetical protein